MADLSSIPRRLASPAHIAIAETTARPRAWLHDTPATEPGLWRMPGPWPRNARSRIGPGPGTCCPPRLRQSDGELTRPARARPCPRGRPGRGAVSFRQPASRCARAMVGKPAELDLPGRTTVRMLRQACCVGRDRLNCRAQCGCCTGRHSPRRPSTCRADLARPQRPCHPHWNLVDDCSLVKTARRISQHFPGPPSASHWTVLAAAISSIRPNPKPIQAADRPGKRAAYHGRLQFGGDVTALPPDGFGGTSHAIDSAERPISPSTTTHLVGLTTSHRAVWGAPSSWAAIPTTP